MILGYQIVAHMASWLTGDTTKVNLWKKWNRNEAVAAAAIASVCSNWSKSLRGVHQILLVQHRWQIPAMAITSYLTGTVSDWHTPGDHFLERAAAALPLYRTCAMWRSALRKPMDILWREDYYANDCWDSEDSDSS